MTHTEQAADRVKALVEELRIGADDWGADQLMDQAADALTALQARVGELEGALNSRDAFIVNAGLWEAYADSLTPPLELGK